MKLSSSQIYYEKYEVFNLKPTVAQPPIAHTHYGNVLQLPCVKAELRQNTQNDNPHQRAEAVALHSASTFFWGGGAVSPKIYTLERSEGKKRAILLLEHFLLPFFLCFFFFLNRLYAPVFSFAPSPKRKLLSLSFVCLVVCFC